MDSCSKTKRRFYDRHIVSTASPNTDVEGENMTWRDPARSEASALTYPYFINSDGPARWGTGLSNKKV